MCYINWYIAKIVCVWVFVDSVLCKYYHIIITVILSYLICNKLSTRPGFA